MHKVKEKEKSLDRNRRCTCLLCIRCTQGIKRKLEVHGWEWASNEPKDSHLFWSEKLHSNSNSIPVVLENVNKVKSTNKCRDQRFDSQPDISSEFTLTNNRKPRLSPSASLHSTFNSNYTFMISRYLLDTHSHNNQRYLHNQMLISSDNSNQDLTFHQIRNNYNYYSWDLIRVASHKSRLSPRDRDSGVTQGNFTNTSVKIRNSDLESYEKK
jgi:hypothetical protein